MTKETIITGGANASKNKYCVKENDGVALCVCKHKPCIELRHKTAECNRLEEDLTALQQTYEVCEKEYKSLNIKHNAILKENAILKSRVNILETQVNNLLENTSEFDD